MTMPFSFSVNFDNNVILNKTQFNRKYSYLFIFLQIQSKTVFIDFTILFVKLAKTVYKKGKKANQRFDKCIINTICINQIV